MYNPKEKKKDILMAALKIFGKDGFYKAKVSDIAKEADIGKGTIYEYFDSKKNLFEEMTKFCVGNNIKKMQSLLEEEKGVIDKLKKYIHIEEESMHKYGNIAYIFIQEADKIGDNVKCVIMEFREKKIEIIQTVIEEGIRSGIFKNVSAEITTISFMGATHQLLLNRIIFGNKGSIEDITETFLEIFVNGIKR